MPQSAKFDFYRSRWNEFPDCVIHADEKQVRGHPCYLAAKTGDSDAAYKLVRCFLNELKRTHGDELNQWWQRRFGFDYDCLTSSEARYLIRTPSADRIRDRITAAVQE
jgi:hypothetical protein